jgi:hypothetical protein
VKVTNVHERLLAASLVEVGQLLDSLSGPADRLWPRANWPPMRFDRPLQVGAVGGHGPVRYVVEAYEPGHRVRFRFTAPSGFDGGHAFELRPQPDGQTVIRHELRMVARGPALMTWPLVFRPLHDALIEDAFATAADHLAIASPRRPWSLWVRVLRGILRRRRIRRERHAI